MVFRSYAAVAHETLGEAMAQAELEARSIRNDDLNEQQRSASVMHYHLLVSLCRDAALDRVINAGVLHGLEAWRLLKERYEPRLRQRRASQLLGLMKWNFQGDILSRMESFEREMQNYERYLGGGAEIQDVLAVVVFVLVVFIRE